MVPSPTSHRAGTRSGTRARELASAGLSPGELALGQLRGLQFATDALLSHFLEGPYHTSGRAELAAIILNLNQPLGPPPQTIRHTTCRQRQQQKDMQPAILTLSHTICIMLLHCMLHTNTKMAIIHQYRRQVTSQI